MGWSGFHFAFELGDAVAKEHRQFGCGEIIPVAARALLYQLEGETKIRGKFAGRLWTHSTDPDCEMRGNCKDVIGSQTSLSRKPWLLLFVVTV